MDKLGNGGKGIGWNTEHEVKQLGELNGVVTDGGRDRRACRRSRPTSTLRSDPELAPETNGEVAVKAWEALGKQTGRDHTHLAAAPRGREDPLPRHPGAAAQDHHLADLVAASRARQCRYNAGYTNVHELIPWRTLTGRQQFYQDHRWMRAFGEGFASLPAAGRHSKTIAGMLGIKPQRQSRDRAELHHAAPEVGHPLDLHRQPADAHAEPRRADACGSAKTTRSAPASSTTTGSSSSTSTARWRRAPWSASASSRAWCMMYHAQEKIVNTPGSRDHRRSAAASTTR